MKLTREERGRIIRGDYSALARAKKPEVEPGEQIVVSRSRPKGAVVYDRSTGDEIVYPKPPTEPLLWIIIQSVVRHKKGGWRVKFDVVDRRPHDLYVRRKPPTAEYGDEDQERKTDEEVRRDSAYTTDPSVAVDHLKAVETDVVDEFTRRARAKEALDAVEAIATAREILGLLEQRAAESDAFRRQGKLTIHRMKRELDRLIQHQRRKAA